MVVLNDQGKVLLGKRKNAVYEKNWGMFGGGIELGEEILLAGERELREETSLIAEDVRVLGVVREFQAESLVDYIHFVLLCDLLMQTSPWS